MKNNYKPVFSGLFFCGKNFGLKFEKGFVILLLIYYISKMKYYTLLIIFILFSTSLEAFPKGKEEKTFLILFNKSELKKIESSTEYIELNFFEKFRTKSYSGNSEAAILITVPNGEMDECQIGGTLVQVNHSTWIPLEEIAFRIIDINESKENYRALASSNGDKKKKHLVRLKL